MKKLLPMLTLAAVPLFALALAAVLSAQTITIDPACEGEVKGEGAFKTWTGHFLDGGRLCDAEGEDHGGTSGADGVSSMDFDGDCDPDLITGWEESGKVFIYLNPMRTVRPAGGCPVKTSGDNTQLRSDAIARQWPLIEVTRDGHPDSPFAGVEDAVFADNDGDAVADYVVIATEIGRRKTFISFPTRLVVDGKASPWKWHTFDAKSGDEYFMRAVIGNIDNKGCPDILVGSKTVDGGPSGDIRWWACPAAGWAPQLWKAGTALPSFGSKTEADYFRDLWGDHHLIATDIEWIMEMNIVNLVAGANPGGLGGYTEILFTDRRKVGYFYLVDPAHITSASSWRYVNIDNPDGDAADFRWYWMGQLVDSDEDGNFALDDLNDPPEIVAAYNEDVGRGVFARWYEAGDPQTITLDGKTITVPKWARYEVVVDGADLPWGGDDSTGVSTRQNKATGIADVDGDGHPEIIATIRGSKFSGAFYLKPESGVEPPRCDKKECDPETQEWVIHRITPHYQGNIKFDNLVLVDADSDCDIDVFSVEENGVGDYGLGTVWYENRLPQGDSNWACNHAPQLSAAQASVTSLEGSPVLTSGDFQDADNDIVTITSSIGTVDTQQNARTWSWTYTPPDGPIRNQVLTLTATDDRGMATSITVFLQVDNVAPAVNAVIVGPDPADVRETVAAAATFVDPAGIWDTPYRCTVNYGDGSGDQNGIVAGDSCSGPAHTYGAAGSYNVVITVYDDDNAVGSMAASAPVTNLPPVVSAPVVSPAASAEGNSVGVTAGFSDRGVNGPYTCTVNYGDGGGASVGAVSGSNCIGPAHAYADNGAYQIAIVVSDKDGVSGTANQTHQVTNVAPTVSGLTIGPNPADAREAVTAAAAFADPGGVHDAPYRCIVNYGDGSGDLDGIVTGNNCSGPAHAYSADGNYAVNITVHDKDQGVGTATATAVVTNVPPVVSAPVVSPVVSAEGSSVSVTAGFGDGGVNGPYTCTVSYGDGSGALAGVVSGSVCNGPAHTYNDNGGFQVTVVVTDHDGLSGTANLTHQAINVAPTGQFAVTPMEIFVGESAEASFSSVFDPSAADSVAGLSYSYDCNSDGIWEGTGHSLGRFSCRFINSGTFTVTGQIRDKDDGRTGYSAVVTVLSPQQATQALIDDVNALVAAGGLRGDLAASLIAKLEAATASLDRGDSIAAVNEIEAFEHEVEALTIARIIGSTQSQLLLETAQRLLDAVDVLN